MQMTYILAFSQPGMNAIISDMRSTNLQDRTQQDYACKSGRLFPGCIYGITGNAFQAKSFLKKFRLLHMTKTKRMEELWTDFSEFSEFYEYPQRNDEYFQIVLSERTQDKPCFHTVDSNYKLQMVQRENEEGVHLYGSGITRLYQFTEEWVLLKVAEAKAELVGRYGWNLTEMNSVSPYLVCQLLSDKTLAYEASLLNEIGVGGAFYFIYQTSTHDLMQKPAMYIHFAVDQAKQRGVAYTTRVRYTRYGPIFDCPHVTSRYPLLLFDPLLDKSRLDLEAVEAEASYQLSSPPYFYYCGIDRLEPDIREVTGFVVKEDGQYNDIFDKNYQLNPNFDRIEICILFGKPPPL
jgi:hypothetical protein